MTRLLANVVIWLLASTFYKYSGGGPFALLSVYGAGQFSLWVMLKIDAALASR